ncbi:hypothetical protein MMC20_003533 [Loxospora ochrophaea]|nr:hypothetical protein [Loxospora ochrophaea]
MLRMLRYFAPYTSIGLALISFVGASSVHINVYASVPGRSSQIVDHAFPGFGIEYASFPSYAGNHSHPNAFSRNLVEVISNKTGQGAFIRLGGTSGDHGVFDPNQSQAVIIPRSQQGKNVPFNISIGPSWFEGFSNFPGTKYIYQVHLAKRGEAALANTVLEAEESIQAIGISNIDSVEIGNEPNLYAADGDRPEGYGPANHVQEWLKYSAAFSGNTSLPEGPIYQALTLAWRPSPPWNL